MTKISAIRNILIKHNALNSFIENSISYNSTNRKLLRFGGHFPWSMSESDWGAIYQELTRKSLHDFRFTLIDLQIIGKIKTLKD